MRRVNERLMADVPGWFYTRNVKSILAQDVLRARPGSGRPALPPELLKWAAQEAELCCAGLSDLDVQVTGDLADLLADRDLAQVGLQAAVPAEMVDAAVASAVALAGQLYQHMYPERLPRHPHGGPRRALSRLEWRMLNGRFVQAGLRRASHRRTVQRLRVAIWRVLIRPGRQPAPVPARPPDVIEVGGARKAA